VKGVWDICENVESKNKIKKKIQCERGSRYYRESKFSKKNKKIQCERGSGHYRESKFSKKIRKSSVKGVRDIIGSLNFRKKIENPV